MEKNILLENENVQIGPNTLTNIGVVANGRNTNRFSSDFD